jgi:hypothetical protein
MKIYRSEASSMARFLVSQGSAQAHSMPTILFKPPQLPLSGLLPKITPMANPSTASDITKKVTKKVPICFALNEFSLDYRDRH